MTFKKALLFTHRWLGFITGLVVFIVSITGCIFCFQDEIQDALYSYRTVTEHNRQYVSPSALKNTALKKYPGGTASYIYYYGKTRPAAVLVSTSKPEQLIYVYINPYSGAVTHTEALNQNFFVIVENIHLYLLLPDKIGGMVVGVSVIIFIVMMITGIILWWPKRKSDRKRSFSIKWNARWRRVNYDLHNVLGFYATAIAIILALTGLSIAFDWVTDGIYKTANLGKKYPAEKMIPMSKPEQKPLTGTPAIDQAFNMVLQRSAKAEMFLIHDDTAANGTIGITTYPKSLHYGNSDDYAFDKYSVKLLQYLPLAKKSRGLALNQLNYDIHVGQVLGLPGKIIAFLASLVCASLPVTGFIIWLGKKNKTRKRAVGK